MLVVAWTWTMQLMISLVTFNICSEITTLTLYATFKNKAIEESPNRQQHVISLALEARLTLFYTQTDKKLSID